MQPVLEEVHEFLVRWRLVEIPALDQYAWVWLLFSVFQNYQATQGARPERAGLQIKGTSD